MNSAEQVNIGEAASHSGVSAKLVRHHESLGLLPAVEPILAELSGHEAVVA